MFRLLNSFDTGSDGGLFVNHRPVAVSKLKVGMIVASPVLSDSGKLLLYKGAALTADIIQYLQGWQVSYVQIFNPGKTRVAKPELQELYKETLQTISLTFENVRMFQEVPVAECKKLVTNYIAFMVDVVGVVESLYRMKGHSEYTYRHLLNVSIISGLIGKWLGMKEEERLDLMLAGLLHDIGKTCIEKKVLDKPGKLTNEEMAVMRMHPQHGYRLIARSNDVSSLVKLAILQHHERDDGSGYPLGLQCNDITLAGKIVAIADIYDAMTSERVYQQKQPPFAVVETIMSQMYGKLAPELCLTFISNLNQNLVGALVQLSDGQVAKVLLFSDILSSRPIVQLESGICIDLEKRQDITIVAVLDEVPKVALKVQG